MNGPRKTFCFCGVSEALFGRGDRLRKWEKRDLRWAIVDYIPTLDRVLQTEVYTRAFRQWSDVCGLSFDQTLNQSEADFLILTRNIDGSGGTLAEHQLPYGQDAQLRGWFDVGDRWTATSLVEQNMIDLLAVATHEFGHGIGLSHIKSPGNLMNPFYDSAVRSPQADDIAEAQRRYGRSNIPPPTIPPPNIPPPITPPAPTPEVDYPVRVMITMASGASYPALVPNH